MGTYKRRVIYMSDEEWAALSSEGRERRTTISAVIRHAVWMRDRKPDQAWAKANEPIQLAEREVRRAAPKPRSVGPAKSGAPAPKAATKAATAGQRQHRIDEVLHRVSRAD